MHLHQYLMIKSAFGIKGLNTPPRDTPEVREPQHSKEDPLNGEPVPGYGYFADEGGPLTIFGGKPVRFNVGLPYTEDNDKTYLGGFSTSRDAWNWTKDGRDDAIVQDGLLWPTLGKSYGPSREFEDAYWNYMLTHGAAPLENLTDDKKLTFLENNKKSDPTSELASRATKINPKYKKWLERKFNKKY